MEFIEKIDFYILDFIQQYLSSSYLDVLSYLLSVSVYVIWIVVIVYFLIKSSSKKTGICLVLGLGICLFLGNVILKNLFMRARPYDVKEGVESAVRLFDYSFPSAHTALCFTGSTIIYNFDKKQGMWFYIYAVLVGFSRLYMYVHYPSDVIAGAVLGVICGLIGLSVCKRLIKVV